MEYQYKYKDLEERQAEIAKAEGEGLRMLSDTFDNPKWKRGDPMIGTMTFTDKPEPVSVIDPAEEEERITCEEYLSYSSDVITQPEIWYLLRVFGKKLGYKVD